MARDYGTIRADLWGDSDWRLLSRGAQWLYMYLLSSPKLSYVGVTDWRPNRIAGVVSGETEASVRESAEELEARRFIFTDDDKEEVVIRSFLRHDGVLLNPNLWKSMKNDFADISSESIRRLLAHEVNRLRDESPEGITTPKGKLVNPWGSQYLQTMLDTPSETPWGTPSETRSDRGSDTPSGRGSPPTPTPTPSSKEDIGALNSAPQKRGTRLPENWEPSDEDVSVIEKQCPGYDHRRETLNFKDYWLAQTGKSAVKLDWSLTWRSWMRRNYDRLPAHLKPTPERKVKVFV